MEKRTRIEAKGNRKKGGRCRNEEKRNGGEALKRGEDYLERRKM
jgi:hypothetical protein